MIKFLDVTIEFNSAIVTLQCVGVILLQKVNAAQSEVCDSLLAVAVDGRSKELRRFGEVATRSSERSHGKHIAEAL